MKKMISLFILFSISTTLFGQEMKPLKSISTSKLPPDYVAFNKLGLNKIMPAIDGITLNDIKVDSLFFKNKVTVLNFSYVGCTPCMREVEYLNQINEKYKNQDVNVLSIFSINRQGLLDFLNAKEGIYKNLRQHAPFDTINYILMPECLGEKEDYRNGVRPQCNRISKYYGVQGYPLTIIIGRDRVVRYISEGFAINATEAESIKNKWINIIDGLLE
ncbi:MAG: peroxiredoxin family protein [Mangrovibacterium sp.]